MRQRARYVLSAIRRDPRILKRFWSRVEQDDSEDGCWEWKGHCSQPGYPAFHVGQWSVAPSHIVWLSRTGALPLGGRMHRLCDNSMCVRPSHLAWSVGRVTEQRLVAEGDGYVPLAGVEHALDERTPGVPTVVRLVSSAG